MSELKRLFDVFKNKYHKAVIRDEALGNDDGESAIGSYGKERKAREAWAEANAAEREFLEALARVDA